MSDRQITVLILPLVILAYFQPSVARFEPARERALRGTVRSAAKLALEEEDKDGLHPMTIEAARWPRLDPPTRSEASESAAILRLQDRILSEMTAEELKPLADSVALRFSQAYATSDLAMAKDLARTLATLDSMVVDFYVESEPAGSKVSLWIRNHSEPDYATVTNNNIRNVYLGTYIAKARKAGCKPAQTKVDLFLNSDKLTCVLIKEDAVGESYCKQ